MIREVDLQMLFNRASKKYNTSECKKDKQLKPNSFVLKLTTNCNMCCEYCYMGDKSISLDNMEEFILYKILNEIKYISDNHFTIYLHGGEPCLKLDLIHKICDWIDKKQLKDNVNLMLQTNGTIINYEIIELIKKYNIKVGISLDGVNDKSNQARVYNNNQQSVDQVLNNIKILIDNHIEVGIFSVLSNYNVNYMKENLEVLNNLGVKSFVINPLVLWGKAKNKKNLMVSNNDLAKCYCEVIDWISEHNSNVRKENYVKERNVHWWFEGIAKGIKGYMCNCSPCGAGIQTLAFSPKGNVYICDQFYGDNEFELGNIKNTKLDKLLYNGKEIIGKIRNVNQIEYCKKCIWRYVCCGGCSARSYYYYGNMNNKAPYCEAYKTIFKHIDIKLQHESIML